MQRRVSTNLYITYIELELVIAETHKGLKTPYEFLVIVITYLVYLSNKLLREPELRSDMGEKLEKTRQEKREREPKEFKTSTYSFLYSSQFCLVPREACTGHPRSPMIALYRYLPIGFR